MSSPETAMCLPAERQKGIDVCVISLLTDRFS